MQVNWFKLFSKTVFNSTGLVQRTLNVTLEGIGDKEILITKGNLLSILYEGILLPINFQDHNPYSPDQAHFVYLDSEQNVWLGIAA